MAQGTSHNLQISMGPGSKTKKYLKSKYPKSCTWSNPKQRKGTITKGQGLGSMRVIPKKMSLTIYSRKLKFKISRYKLISTSFKLGRQKQGCAELHVVI